MSERHPLQDGETKQYPPQARTLADDKEAICTVSTPLPILSTAATLQSQQAAIELCDLCKYFKTFLAVDHLSLQVEQGEIFGLLGPDGAGKTTLLNMMSGLNIPTSGEICVYGYKLPRELRQVRQILSSVPQQCMLYEELSAWDNLDFYANLMGIPRKEKELHLNSILMLVQLLEYRHAFVKTFSYSMKRRLVLGRALLRKPELIYLDEPAAGVDAQSRRAIWDYVLALRILGKTVVIATSSLEEALELCDRIAILDRGKLVAVETPGQIKQCYGDIVVELEMAHPFVALSELQAVQGVQSAIQDGVHLVIVLQDSRRILPHIITLLAQQSEIKDISVRELRLGEIFPHLKGP